MDGALPVSLPGATAAWNTRAVRNGRHTLTATVTDAAGRTATATCTVSVGNRLRLFGVAR